MFTITLVSNVSKGEIKLIVINDDYRLLNKGNVNEGGLARTEAIIGWLTENKRIDEIRLTNSRIKNAVIVLKFLRKTKNADIFIFYPTVGMPVLRQGIAGRICSDLFISALNKACLHNKIIIDISDLKYEQAIDLEIDNNRLKAMERTEKRLFDSSCEFVFASESMKEYAANKYSIPLNRCHVLDNGGSFKFTETDIPKCDSKIKLVYAGTLNKGRCIEAMIDSVKNIHNAVLYLCGIGGDWIKEEENVKYLGPLDESCAHYVVSQCDIGLIPYDSSRLYYNIAYPTKLAFYITAGIPFISTDTKEVLKIYEKYNIGYISEMNGWNNLFESIDIEEIKKQKARIKTFKNDFTWDYKCQNSILSEL